MSPEEFRSAVAPEDEGEPSSIAALPGPLRALWRESRGDWDAAHALVQDDNSADAAWVHAYLHRREGDLGNAAYWYSRARRPVVSGSLDEEWSSIARALLAAAG